MANFVANPLALQLGVDKAFAGDTQSGLRVAVMGPYTHTGGAGLHTVDLVKLPAGRIRVFGTMSKLLTSVFAASSTVSLGTRVYVDEKGTSVAQAANAFVSAVSANPSAADTTLDESLAATAIEYFDFNSRDGITVYLTVAGGNIEDTDTVNGWITFAKLD